MYILRCHPSLITISTTSVNETGWPNRAVRGWQISSLCPRRRTRNIRRRKDCLWRPWHCTPRFLWKSRSISILITIISSIRSTTTTTTQHQILILPKGVIPRPQRQFQSQAQSQASSTTRSTSEPILCARMRQKLWEEARRLAISPTPWTIWSRRRPD